MSKKNIERIGHEQINYLIERKKCKDFLNTYKDSHNELKYRNILADISNLKQNILEISLDDIIHSNID